MLGQCTGDQPGYASRRGIEPAESLERQWNKVAERTWAFCDCRVLRLGFAHNAKICEIAKGAGVGTDQPRDAEHQLEVERAR